MTTKPEISAVRRAQRQETSRRSWSRDKGAVCFEFTDKHGERKRARIDRGVDPTYSDAITASEPDAREFSDALPEHPLPGAGEQRDDCGDLIPVLVCEECWATKEVGRTCGSPDCPRCNSSWAFYRGIEMGAKLHDLSKRLNEHVFKHHLTVSLRDSTRFDSKNPLDQAREAVKHLLPKVGVDTGYLVFHPYRIAEEYRGDVLGHESGSGDMTWKDVLSKVEGDTWSWEAIRDEFLVYSPHFHVICLSGFVDCTGVGEIEEETGVVIHRITTEREDGNEKSIADVGELAKVLGYSLTHTGIAPKSERQTHRADVRAFGQVANHDVGEADPSRMEVKEAMRRVAPTILGVEFPEPECNESVPTDRGDEHEHDPGPAGVPSEASSAVSGGGGPKDDPSPSPLADAWETGSSGLSMDESDPWGETAGIVPDDLNTPTAGQMEPCEGQMIPIWQAEVALGDLGEIERVRSAYGEERVHGLRKAIERWHGLGEPRPDGPGDGGDPSDTGR